MNSYGNSNSIFGGFSATYDRSAKRSEAAKKGAETKRQKRAAEAKKAEEAAKLLEIRKQERERDARGRAEEQRRAEIRRLKDSFDASTRELRREVDRLTIAVAEGRKRERAALVSRRREINDTVTVRVARKLERAKYEQKRQEKRTLARAEEAAEREFERLVPPQLREILPSTVQGIVREIVADPSLREGVVEMMGRERDFKTPLAALMAGIAILPESSRHFDDRLDEHWANRKFPSMDDRIYEVVIGGGLHAAIYSAVRVAKGHKPPVVLEAAPRAGGVFAVSKGPSFYLNSRNRPGQLSLPGQDGALNVLPGAIVQPSDLEGDEYPTNQMLAWAVRSTLAMSADVHTGTRVKAVDGGLSNGYRVTLESGRVLTASRVVIATGLGVPKNPFALVKDDPRILSFAQMMARMDSQFPLRGMRRVAVIGCGDSGRTAVEALTGQGPTTNWSVASLDWIERIDWYGCTQRSREQWTRCNRSRYRGLARLFPDYTPEPTEDDYENGEAVESYLRAEVPFRIKPMPRARSVAPGYECVYVNERPYDYVIDCTGFNQEQVPLNVGGGPAIPSGDAFRVGGREVGRRYYNGYESCFVIGPASALPISSEERQALEGAAAVPENATAVFRYAPRTAALAASLA